MGDRVEQLIAVLNGVVGHYLERTKNGLSTPMQLIDGPARDPSSSRAIVLVHGLMCTETVFRMHPRREASRASSREGADGSVEDYGTLLARDLGYRPFYVRYNTGRHVSENGEALDRVVEDLVDRAAAAGAPLTEIALLGHSMGGLVIRSACHVASEIPGRRWLPLVRRAFYVGSPHLGAPLERVGNTVSWALARIPNPVTELLAEIANLRSDGVKDLRYANLRREDWEGRDADALLQNHRHPVPLLPSIRHHLIAGTLADDPVATMLFGDALVPLASATGSAKPHHRSAIFPREHVEVFPGIHHLSLAHRPEVYATIRRWCEEPLPEPGTP